MGVGILVFHAVAGSFQIADHFNLAQQHRNCPNAWGKQSLPTYVQMLPLVVVNQVLVLLPLMLLLERAGVAFHEVRATPSLGAELFAVIVMTVGHDMLFYIFHRFVLHSPHFRFLRHDIHHTSKAHSGVSAMYMHPADFVLEIALPYLVPLVIAMRMNAVVVPAVTLAAGSVGGVVEHSGYNLTGMNIDTTTHFLHHRKGHCSFSDGLGSPGLMDTAFGTACMSAIPALYTVLVQIQSYVRRTRSRARTKRMDVKCAYDECTGTSPACSAN